jgi:hypothetical protein
MTAPAWPPGLPEPDRIAHRWSCSRPPAEDAYRVGQTGQLVIVRRCPACGRVERGAEDVGDMNATNSASAPRTPLARQHRDRRAVAARPACTMPHSWRSSRPPSEDHLITDQDGRQQIVKHCPGCKFGAVNPSVDGGREIAGGGVGRGAIQIGGTGLDSSDGGKGHEDAEHHSGGRRASAGHQHLALGRSVLLQNSVIMYPGQ